MCSDALGPLAWPLRSGGACGRACGGSSWRRIGVVVLATVSLFGAPAAAAPSLQIGASTERGASVFYNALSGDGATVASRSLVHVVVDGTRRFQLASYLWTRQEGLSRIDAFGAEAPDPLTFVPHALSGDGAKIVGSENGVPVLWERGVGTTELAGLAMGTEGGAAHGISADGQHIVGTYHDGGFYESSRLLPDGTYAIDVLPSRVPVRWDASGQIVEALSPTRGLAFDVSNDGVAVGSIDLLEESAFPAVAFRWDETRGTQLIPELTSQSPAQPSSDVGGISDDGTTLVGQTVTDIEIAGLPSTNFPAYLWNGDPGEAAMLPLDGMEAIFPADTQGYPFRITMTANDVSADGSTVVGGYRSPDAAGLTVPFVWTRAAGFQDLGQLLESMGVSTEDWTLYEATHVSADGKTISGQGRWLDERRASRDTVWVAVIPEPSTALLLGGGLAWLASGRKPVGARSASATL